MRHVLADPDQQCEGGEDAVQISHQESPQQHNVFKEFGADLKTAEDSNSVRYAAVISKLVLKTSKRF